MDARGTLKHGAHGTPRDYKTAKGLGVLVMWKRTDEEMPQEGVDVLIYSEVAQGYAVAIVINGTLVNSITRQPFRPLPSHWMFLPAPPTGISGYRSLSAVPN